jgi:hypothetical protein
MDLYMKVIFNHLNNNLPFDYLQKSHGVSDGATLAHKLLTPKAVVELSRAAEGVMRDLLNIFILAISRAAKESNPGQVEAIHVVEAAYLWFERDKLQSITRETASALARLEEKLLGELKYRFFAVPSDAARSSLIVSLLDSRLIHAVWKNMPSPGNPGTRYNIYCLDYGSCLSIVRADLRYSQKVKYYDIMEQLAVKFERVDNFDSIVTSDLFGLEQGLR